MTGDNLPGDHHIVRYVKPSLIEDEAVDGSAFLLRPDELGLSVNWLEAFGYDDEDRQLSEVRRLFSLRLSRNGRFAKLNVGAIKRYVSEVMEELGIVEELGIIEKPCPPTDKFDADPSHAEIIGVPPRESDEAMRVGDQIADCVIYPLRPGRTD